MDKKKMFSLVGAVIATVIVILLFTNKCEGPKTEINISHIPAVSTDAHLASVEFYLDNSGSMRGYCDFKNLPISTPQGNFINTCSRFLNSVSKIGCTTNIYCGNFKTSNRSEFIRKLGDGSAFNGAQSEIDVQLEKIAKNLSDSSVSVFASDLILSFGRPVLMAKGKGFGVAGLPTLSAKITTVATDIKKAGQDIVVIQYKSPFNGKYYYNCTENLEFPNNDTNFYKSSVMLERPYYLVLIGTKDNLVNVLGTNAVRKEDYTAIYSTLTYDSNVYINDPTNRDFSVGAYDLAEGEIPVPSVAVDCNVPDVWEVLSWTKFEIPAFLGRNLADLQLTYSGNAIKKVEVIDDSSIKIDFKNSGLSQGKYPGKITFTSAAAGMEDSYLDNDLKDDADEYLTIEALEGKTYSLGAFIKGINQAYFEKDMRDPIIVAEIINNLEVK